MDNETIGQALGILAIAIYTFLGGRAFLQNRKKSNSKTATDSYPALTRKDDDSGQAQVMTAKRDDAVGALVVTSNVLGDTLAALKKAQEEIRNAETARIEDAKSRAELRAQVISLQTDITVLKVDALEREKANKEQVSELRAAIASLKAQLASQETTITDLRKAISDIRSDTNAKEREYKQQIAAQAAQLKEQDAIIAKQHGQIKALLTYFEALLPLLKKAGIKTEELPQLPDILETNHGGTSVIETPAITPAEDDKAG